MTSVFQKDFLRGKIAVVTGGGSGICKGMTKALMNHGAQAAIISRNLEKLQEAAKELELATGSKCIAIQGDVRDYTTIEAAFKKIAEHYGKIDIVVCGAAGNFLAPVEKLSANAFKTVVDIDLQGTFNTSKAALPYLKHTKGTIINVSATLQYAGTPLQAHACAAKAGIDAMTKVLAIEWGQHGIRINTIAPGPIAGTVGISKLTPKDAKEDYLAKLVPLQRYGTVDDIGNATLFLVSDAASYMTGTVTVVDGGQWLVGYGGMYSSLYIQPKSKL